MIRGEDVSWLFHNLSPVCDGVSNWHFFIRNKNLPFPFLGLKCMTTAWENFHHGLTLLKGRVVGTVRVNKIKFI